MNLMRVEKASYVVPCIFTWTFFPVTIIGPKKRDLNTGFAMARSTLWHSTWPETTWKNWTNNIRQNRNYHFIPGGQFHRLSPLPLSLQNNISRDLAWGTQQKRPVRNIFQRHFKLLNPEMIADVSKGNRYKYHLRVPDLQERVLLLLNEITVTMILAFSHNNKPSVAIPWCFIADKIFLILNLTERW